MHDSIQVSLPRILDVFAEFRIRPREVGTRHIHKVSETAHDSTISTMESWIRREVILISGETGARLHGCEGRDTVPHREGTQDVLSKMTMRQKSTAGSNIFLNLAPEVCMHFTIVGAIETS
jgi:hypothetical protein